MAEKVGRESVGDKVWRGGNDGVGAIVADLRPPSSRTARRDDPGSRAAETTFFVILSGPRSGRVEGRKRMADRVEGR
jgi:hypothetical protein